MNNQNDKKADDLPLVIIKSMDILLDACAEMFPNTKRSDLVDVFVYNYFGFQKQEGIK